MSCAQSIKHRAKAANFDERDPSVCYLQDDNDRQASSRNKSADFPNRNSAMNISYQIHAPRSIYLFFRRQTMARLSCFFFSRIKSVNWFMSVSADCATHTPTRTVIELIPFRHQFDMDKSLPIRFLSKIDRLSFFLNANVPWAVRNLHVGSGIFQRSRIHSTQMLAFNCL